MFSIINPNVNHGPGPPATVTLTGTPPHRELRRHRNRMNDDRKKNVFKTFENGPLFNVHWMATPDCLLRFEVINECYYTRFLLCLSNDILGIRLGT